MVPQVHPVERTRLICLKNSCLNSAVPVVWLYALRPVKHIIANKQISINLFISVYSTMKTDSSLILMPAKFTAAAFVEKYSNA